MLCAFPSRHFRNVVESVLPVTDSCFLPEPLIRTHSDSFTFECSVYTQDTVNSFLDHQQNKWLRHGVIHSSHNTNPVASLGLRIHRRRLKQKFHKAQARVWAESTTCFQEFCVSEHLPDQVFSKQRHIMRFKFRATT